MWQVTLDLNGYNTFNGVNDSIKVKRVSVQFDSVQQRFIHLARGDPLRWAREKKKNRNNGKNNTKINNKLRVV